MSQYFWPENFRINDLAIELVERGHEVTVLTGEPNYPDGRVFEAYRADPGAFSRYGGAAVLRVPIVVRGRSSVRLLLNYLSFAVGGSILGAWKLRGRRFDAIFVFQTSPITAALPAILQRRFKRAPLLMWVLDLWPDTLSAVGVVRSPRLLGLVAALVRWIRYFPGWAEAVFADDSGAASAPAQEVTRFADDFKVMFAGNMGEAQDFPAILDAAELLKDRSGLRWIVVGDGRAAADVRSEISRRGLEDKVVLLGRHPLERMPAFFAAADALLVTLRPEPIWSMTIPGKVQSYLAAGKPLLAMLDGEGAGVIVESGAGLVAPAGDSRALAANVELLMAMGSATRKAMGSAGIRYGAEQFDRRRLVDSLEQWIAETRAA